MTTTNKIVISSGHALHVRGAAKLIDEVTEARRVVDRVYAILKASGVGVLKFHDDKSKTQAQNLATITKYHNAQQRALDVSIHFNAASFVQTARGCEVLHYDAPNQAKAARLAAAISKAGGLKDRGAKQRTNLAFLRDTSKPALLIEVCFVDSEADVKQYKNNFEAICQAIAEALAGFVGHDIASAKKAQEAATGYFIRTGTFTTKEQAEAAVAKMQRLQLVKVATVHTSAVAKKYYIKTGTFSSKAAAEAALEKMKQNKIIWVGSVEKA